MEKINYEKKKNYGICTKHTLPVIGITSTAGITLIALIVTIVVLLILAGVTINAITGSENVMEKAQEAADKTELGALRDEVNLVLINHELSSKTIEQDLKDQFGENAVTKPENVNDAYYITKNGHSFTVYDDGEVAEGKAIWNGESEVPEFKQENGVWNWYIYTPGQLKFLELFVNAGKTLTNDQKTDLQNAGYNPDNVKIEENVTVYLMNNIDLGARENNGTWTKPADWIPIGYTNKDTHIFTATFEGQNHTIRGAYVNFNANYAGIFGNCHSIKDLTVKNSYIQGLTCVGGIAGTTRGTGSFIIKNCHNINTTVTGTQVVGGILGQVVSGTETNYSQVIGCTNNGNITNTQGSYTGGIVAYLSIYNRLTGCTNNGSVTGEVTSVGGIVGYAATSSQISSCTNNGNISTKKSSAGYSQVGGIVGTASSSSQITSCTNNGSVEGAGLHVGGIVGIAHTLSQISSCTNNGSVVTGKNSNGYSQVGGIVGTTQTSCQISSCTNNGSVTGEGNSAGGIVGVSCGGVVDKCVNHGEIKKNGTATAYNYGGIVGVTDENLSIQITNCYNTASVDGTNTVTYLGGIVAHLNTGVTGSIKYNYNIGKITGKASVGGVIGRDITSANLKKENNFALQGSAPTISAEQLKTEAQMKDTESDTSVLKLLNAGGDNWQIVPGKNNGYPILK